MGQVEAAAVAAAPRGRHQALEAQALQGKEKGHSRSSAGRRSTRSREPLTCQIALYCKSSQRIHEVSRCHAMHTCKSIMTQCCQSAAAGLWPADQKGSPTLLQRLVTCSRPAAGSRARQKPSVTCSRPPPLSDRERRARAATLSKSSGAGSTACNRAGVHLLGLTVPLLRRTQPAGCTAASRRRKPSRTRSSWRARHTRFPPRAIHNGDSDDICVCTATTERGVRVMRT